MPKLTRRLMSECNQTREGKTDPLQAIKIKVQTAAAAAAAAVYGTK